jgi:hypothetical protein
MAARIRLRTRAPSFLRNVNPMTEPRHRRHELTQKIAALKAEIAQAQQELAKLDAAEQAISTTPVATPPSPYAARNRYGRIESGSRS